MGEKKSKLEQIDFNRLDKARELAKAARRALLNGGHQEGCHCNMCTASRLLLSALGLLGEVEAEIAAEKHAKKERKINEKGKGRSTSGSSGQSSLGF